MAARSRRRADGPGGRDGPDHLGAGRGRGRPARARPVARAAAAEDPGSHRRGARLGERAPRSVLPPSWRCSSCGPTAGARGRWRSRRRAPSRCSAPPRSRAAAPTCRRALDHTVRDLAGAATVWAARPGRAASSARRRFPARRPATLRRCRPSRRCASTAPGCSTSTIAARGSSASRGARRAGPCVAGARGRPRAAIAGSAPGAGRRSRGPSRSTSRRRRRSRDASDAAPDPPARRRHHHQLGMDGGGAAAQRRRLPEGVASADIAAYHVDFRPGVTPDDGRRLVAAGLGPRSPLRVESAAGRIARQRLHRHGVLARCGRSRS